MAVALVRVEGLGFRVRTCHGHGHFQALGHDYLDLASPPGLPIGFRVQGLAFRV